MAHEGSGAPVEEERCELGDHRASHILLGDERPVDELTPVEAMLDDRPFLEPRQQSRDGRLCEVALRPEPVLHFQHRRLGAIPEDAHDGELEIGE